MAAKGRGNGNTPEVLVKMLIKAMEEKSLRTISRETGLALAPLCRYVKGISEPSQTTLEKLADYFNVSVSYLLGEQSHMRKIFGQGEVTMFEKVVDDLIKLYDLTPIELKDSLKVAMDTLIVSIENSLLYHVAGVENENEKTLNRCIDRLFKIVYGP